MRYEKQLEQLLVQGIELETVIKKLKDQHIETPSWGYGNAGTRFKVFNDPGAARNIWEKIEDAALVHQLTGICPSIAIHIPWDVVDDFNELRDFAGNLEIKIGAINPNLFQEEEYKLGSITHPNLKIQKKALDHILECIKIMEIVDSRILNLWLPDGTNYPGQDSIRMRKQRMETNLEKIYDALPINVRMLIEYKLFEPALYMTDLSDWGFAYAMCQKLGSRAEVLVDIGHHAHGTNIEQIVAFLIDEGQLGGFHFNDRKYADDDLIAGTVNPLQLFLIYHEIVEAEKDPKKAENSKSIAFMIDQSPNIEPKVEGMIQTVINIQMAYAKALIVDSKTLHQAQQAGDLLEANRVLMGAFNTDVRPLLAYMRQEIGLKPDPIEAYCEYGYYEKAKIERCIQ
jgi:L-rhamnose isomerase/sugar isomerase